jgi:hypothetical protein
MKYRKEKRGSTGWLNSYELFHDYFEKGMTAEEIEGREMIREVRRQNFIPEDIEDLYEEALIKEYERYFESRKK